MVCISAALVFLFPQIYTVFICMYLQAMSSVVIVLEPVIGCSPSRDIQHSNFQLIQCLVGQPQVPDQMPNALITA